MSVQEKSSLYDRLGGIHNTADVVDDFIERLMADPVLNANPAVDEAHHLVSKPGFKYLVTEMAGWATGGPQTYGGRSMRDSHEHLNISPEEWEAFMEDLQQTLNKFQVPQQEREELVSIADGCGASDCRAV
jgi:hemoglobin